MGAISARLIGPKAQKIFSEALDTPLQAKTAYFAKGGFLVPPCKTNETLLPQGFHAFRRDTLVVIIRVAFWSSAARTESSAR
jgi:hypothetical protein